MGLHVHVYVYVCIYVNGDGVNRFVAANLLSNCWLDARGGQTGEMTDYSVVAGMAGLFLSTSAAQRRSAASMHSEIVPIWHPLASLGQNKWTQLNIHLDLRKQTCKSFTIT